MGDFFTVAWASLSVGVFVWLVRTGGSDVSVAIWATNATIAILTALLPGRAR